jgi:hypothetical protein
VLGMMVVGIVGMVNATCNIVENAGAEWSG